MMFALSPRVYMYGLLHVLYQLDDIVDGFSVTFISHSEMDAASWGNDLLYINTLGRVLDLSTGK